MHCFILHILLSLQLCVVCINRYRLQRSTAGESWSAFSSLCGRTTAPIWIVSGFTCTSSPSTLVCATRAQSPTTDAQPMMLSVTHAERPTMLPSMITQFRSLAPGLTVQFRPTDTSGPSCAELSTDAELWMRTFPKTFGPEIRLDIVSGRFTRQLACTAVT